MSLLWAGGFVVLLRMPHLGSVVRVVVLVVYAIVVVGLWSILAQGYGWGQDSERPEPGAEIPAELRGARWWKANLGRWLIGTIVLTGGAVGAALGTGLSVETLSATVVAVVGWIRCAMVWCGRVPIDEPPG